MLVMQFVMIALFAYNTADAAPVETELHAEQWELSRNGERLLGISGIAEVVNEWSSDDRQQIELQYPGGEEGELWVYQLMDWLVALGIPSNNLVAVPPQKNQFLWKHLLVMMKIHILATLLRTSTSSRLMIRPPVNPCANPPRTF